jgi:hypothetical protein
LPSGTIVVSNINEGLFVLTPTYVRACYLEGNIKDSTTLANLSGAYAEILSTTQTDLANSSGDYAAGVPASGTYNIRFSKAGYVTRIINNVSLSNGVVTTLNVKLLQDQSGISSLQNKKSFITVSGNPFKDVCNISYYLETGIEKASIEIFDAAGKLVEKKQLNGASGNFSFGENYEDGLYFVSVRTANGTSIPERVVKMK